MTKVLNLDVKSVTNFYKIIGVPAQCSNLQKKISREFSAVEPLLLLINLPMVL
jgi:hypothetical protein